MAAANDEEKLKQTCIHCKKNRLISTYYYKYKDGSIPKLCKDCQTSQINSYDPETFLYLLKEFDVPYIKVEWDALLEKAYNKNPRKVNGSSVFGRYLGKMRLVQWRNYTYADSDRLNAENEAKQKEIKEEEQKVKDLAKEQFENGIINEHQYRTMVGVEEQHKNIALENDKILAQLNANNPFNEQNFCQVNLPDPAADLTEEDKLYLVSKWGSFYSPQDLLKLERKYHEMMKSFDIQDADTITTLIFLCKTYLKMDAAIDTGDLDGYKKLSSVYDSMRKSAKFTALQNKDDKNSDFDSIGELVVYCERKEGFIPRFATDVPQDKVDFTLRDMNNYVKKLVTEDLGFGQQIEDSIKKIQIQKEMNEQADENNIYLLTNEDHMDFAEMQNKLASEELKYEKG